MVVKNKEVVQRRRLIKKTNTFIPVTASDSTLSGGICITRAPKVSLISLAESDFAPG